MFNKIIKIGSKKIGKNQPVFVIAEAGVNHNGSLNLAKKLVDIAKKAGADAVKFQTFHAEQVVSLRAKKAEYQNRAKGKTQYEMLKKLELSFNDFQELKKYCDKKKIIFLSTPHSEDAIDFLGTLVPVYKIASADLTNLPFLEIVAKKKKPIILSTGMSTLKEVKEAVKIIKKAGNNRIILLHCVANYPCLLEQANLRAMLSLKKEFKDLLVGYSDHTLGIIVPIMAVAVGARVLEKHFTLDKNLSGPDHKTSSSPKELEDMVKMIRSAEKALGNGIKKPNKNEEKIKKTGRKSIIAKKDVKKSNKINRDMLIIKRPGTGILPKYIDRVIGKIAQKNIKKDSLIKLKDLR